MDTIKYLELAVSKDTGRYNLNSIYRDKTCMVATDGHRLHLVGGLAEIEKPHHLSGIDADYPDYQVVLPKDTTEVCSLKIDKKQLKQLKALASLIGKTPIVRMTIANHQLRLEYTSAGVGGWIALGVTDQEATFTPIGIRLDYLMDAIIPDQRITIKQSVSGHNPIMISYDLHQTFALIMPCKLDQAN
ncbi:MAG: hypothetical protein ACK5S6_00455 [bacterium]|jgi:DNA polymerase III sliding clamp (beta) subunit (PCNA family)